MMTAQPTINKDLFDALVKLKARVPDAEDVSNAYVVIDPDAFTTGLETIAKVLAMSEDPNNYPSPICEPWQSIYKSMITSIKNGVDIDQAFRDALIPVDVSLQSSLTNLVGIRMQAILDAAQNALNQQKSSRATNKLQPDDYLSTLTQLGYKFRLNLCNDQVEVNGKHITDSLVSKIKFEMAGKGFWNSGFIDTVIMATAHDTQYHPVKDYLNHLPGYDGGKYIEQVASCFANSDGLFHMWFRKWMIGSIAKVFSGSQNPMLILDGAQGIGKSLFVKWLCSGLSAYFCEGNIDLESKDSYIRLGSKWIWEVGEVGATLRKADQETFKNFLTLAEVTIRKPYGRHDLIKPALASFIGTVNNVGGILDDPTGSRRFLICHIEAIDWRTYTQIDVNKVWGEAYAAYLMGETRDLTPVERKKSEVNNEKYQTEDPIELVINDRYEIDPNRVDWWTSTLEITNVLQTSGVHYSTSRALQMALAGTLKRLNLQQQRVTINGSKISGWTGIKDKLIP
jgi:predicted P-loop ATPase